MRPVDRVLLGYLAVVSVVVGWRLATGAGGPELWALLVMHALFVVLLVLFSRLTPHAVVGGWLRDFYPLIIISGLYTEIGIVNQQLPREVIFSHDALLQRWELAIFGSQPARDWIRAWPSVFWSGVLHLAYFAYYPIVLFGPLGLALRGQRAGARHVILLIMTSYVLCYVVFILFPVAGPNYVFPHPTGPVREVWSARMVYGLLDQGSSIGAAFPSSHVAATVATTLGVAQHWRRMAWVFVPAAVLLTVGTVYCQMHYVIDATAGLVVGVAAWLMVGTLATTDDRTSRATTEPAAAA
ncbi:MAG TPA: phosphatase PAP2 family protein [Gemmatimonadales bacterium]|nr:phosphatase PAP2 family protein [Gemmatimonadales bacterium]